MAQTKTTLSLSTDFAMAEALEEYGNRYQIGRTEALRKILRQVLDPLGEVVVRPPLAWETITEGKRTTHILDVGPGAWVQIVTRYGHYPLLTIEENGAEVLRKSITYSPDAFAIYMAEGLILKRWPHLAQRANTAKTVKERDRDKGLGHWAIDLEEVLRAA